MALVSDQNLTRDVQYPMYDVYNNGYSHGGKLNVTFDRYLRVDVYGVVGLTESRISAKPRYENRINLNDTTIRVGLVVSFVKLLGMYELTLA